MRFLFSVILTGFMVPFLTFVDARAQRPQPGDLAVLLNETTKAALKGELDGIIEQGTNNFKNPAGIRYLKVQALSSKSRLRCVGMAFARFFGSSELMVLGLEGTGAQTKIVMGNKGGERMLVVEGVTVEIQRKNVIDPETTGYIGSFYTCDLRFFEYAKMVVSEEPTPTPTPVPKKWYQFR